MDTHALSLASRFSYAPNSKGYCGKLSAHDAFVRCIRDGDCDTVAEEMRHFIVLAPYLDLIAHASGMTPYDPEVIEAYWIGNDLLHRVKPSHYDILLENFQRQGVPMWLIDELSQKRPTRFIPSHLFQVLHVGVGQASGAVPFSITSVNHCMIRWGEVMEIHSTGAITVRVHELAHRKLRYVQVEKTLQLSPDTYPFDNPRAGDIIAVHWGHVVKILTKNEVKQLSYWTQEVVSTLSVTTDRPQVPS